MERRGSGVSLHPLQHLRRPTRRVMFLALGQHGQDGGVRPFVRAYLPLSRGVILLHLSQYPHGRPDVAPVVEVTYRPIVNDRVRAGGYRPFVEQFLHPFQHLEDAISRARDAALVPRVHDRREGVAVRPYEGVAPTKCIQHFLQEFLDAHGGRLLIVALGYALHDVVVRSSGGDDGDAVASSSSSASSAAAAAAVVPPLLPPTLRIL
mmetsp:Transcript_38445/g.115249  ORF Transcript_38445/g.115249 Transcript_38445/m.115249 type:complete len:207 (-) Transcript_38445:1168-1788(-)